MPGHDAISVSMATGRGFRRVAGEMRMPGGCLLMEGGGGGGGGGTGWLETEAEGSRGGRRMRMPT